MWILLKDFLLVSLGMGIGIVLMCILTVGKEADCEMKSYWNSITNTGRFVVVLPDKYVQGLEVSENHLIMDNRSYCFIFRSC